MERANVLNKEMQICEDFWYNFWYNKVSITCNVSHTEMIVTAYYNNNDFDVERGLKYLTEWCI